MFQAEVTTIFPDNLLNAGLYQPIRLGDVFGDSSKDAIDVLEGIGQMIDVPTGDFLLNSGETPGSLKVLVSGEGIILSGHPKNGLINIRKTVNNEVFGLTEMIAGSSFKYSVLVVTNCKVRSIHKREVEHILETDDKPRTLLIELLAERIQRGERSIHK